jgi:hypothetical protein
MISIDKVLISDDLADEHFVCDLTKCKGACCVEGDVGAPLLQSELQILEQEYDNFKDYLQEEGKKNIEEKGLYQQDEETEWVTPLMEDGACAYSIKDTNGTIHCGIEKAYLEGKTSFKKPISCHLYPARIKELSNYTAVNYDRWHICSPACSLGQELKVKVYQFLKEPLIRRFGEDFYQEMVRVIEHPDRPK